MLQDLKISDSKRQDPFAIIEDLTMSLFPNFLDATAHLYVVNTVGSGNEPNFSTGQPVIGQLDLHAIYDHLLEETILIANGKSGSRIILRGQGIHKASRQTTKAAVSKVRTVFDF